MNKPLVYACAGCSGVGETAYRIARELDRRGIAQMSCLAGVGAAKKHFLNQMKNRSIWVIDGCPIGCGLGVFDLVDRPIDKCLRLHEWEIRKDDPSPEDKSFYNLIERVIACLTSCTVG